MDFVILGNSLVRHLSIPNVEVTAISSLDWEKATHYLMRHRERFAQKYVFIVVGPLRFTSMHQSRREVAFSSNNNSTVHQIFAPFYNELSFLNIFPIICPLFPMNFKTYNGNTCQAPICQGFYEEWNKILRGHIVVENRHIYRFNCKYENNTPHLHTLIYHRRKHHYVFRENLLSDGLHVTEEVLTHWKSEFQRVIGLIRSRLMKAAQETQ